MTPMTAYLNRMHVKADAIRVELDQVCGQVPTLKMFIEDVSSHLKSTDTEARERSMSLSTRLDDLVRTSGEGFSQGDVNRTELSETLHASCHDLGARIVELRVLMEKTSQALESVKFVELPNLGKNLMAMESKVAKWVHSSQLPAKMSEARLFSLEAKLANEMESRLVLEEVVKERGPSRSSPLPELPISRPNTRQGRPPSRAYEQGRPPSRANLCEITASENVGSVAA